MTADEGSGSLRADLEQRNARTRGAGLRQTEATRDRLLHVLEVSLNEIYMFDERTLRFQYVNRGALRNLGFPTDAMRQMTPLDLMPEFSPAQFAGLIAPLQRAEQELINFETTHRRADGTCYPVEVHLQLTTGEDAPWFLAIVLDITGRKQAHIKLRNSESRYRLLVENAPFCIHEIDRQGRFTSMNRAGLRMLSLDKEEDVRGKPYLDCVADSHKSRISQLLTRALQGQASEFQFAAPNQQYFQSSFVPITDASGNVLRLMGISQDITQRRLSEEALRESEARLNEAQHHARIGSWRFVPPDRLIWSNEMYELFQWPRDQPPTYSAILERIHPDDRGHADPTALNQLLDSESSELQTGFRIRRPDGTEISVNSLGRALRRADGSVSEVVGTVQDVTERRKADAERERQAQRLRALARRLVEIREDEQRRISMALHDHVGQNLAALSLNLKIIRGLIPPELQPVVGSRLDESQNLLEAGIEFARGMISELRPAALDDYGLMAGLRWYAAQMEARSGMRVVVEGDEQLPRLPRSEEQALFRIAQEALTNAMMHSRARTVTIRLQSTRGHTLLGITDDGIGADLGQSAGDNSRKHWGLIMMQERAEGIGAELRLQSAPGKGMSIEVDLPGRK